MSAQFLGRVGGDVLVQPAAIGPGGKDSLNRRVFERAVLESVRQGIEEVGGIVPVAQSEDLTGVIARRARLAFLEGEEEGVRRVSETVEGRAQLAEIGTTVGVAGAVPGKDRVLLRAPGLERVMRDQGQVGLVDEELVFGDAHGQDLGDVLVG